MKALSIRQPWAWLIVRPDLTGPARQQAIATGELKDIENRTWPTLYRGPLLIHAAKGMTRSEYEDAIDHILFYGGPDIKLPAFIDLERGGIVGQADLVDCIPLHRATSRWHVGLCGFKLANVHPLPFRPLKGALGLFEVPDHG